jgi:DNA repair protein RadD
MILNSYLPSNELQKTLPGEVFDNIEFILKHMLDEENRINSIYSEKEILGQIHHLINLDKYHSKDFRKKLYDCSHSILQNSWKEYFLRCGSNDIEKNVKFEWGDNEQTKRFVEFFNYPDYIIPDKLSKDETIESIVPENMQYVPLKMIHSYQMPIVKKVLKILKIPNNRCLVQMPTGTGKTRTAMEIVSRILTKDEKHLVVWLAESSELLDQANEEFKHVWGHVGKFPIKSMKIYGAKSINTIPNDIGIIFANYDKLNNLVRRGIIPKANYVVVDEAHQIIATTYNSLLRKISDFRKSTRVIGLTATPGRGLNEQQNRELTEEFYQNIVRIELDDDEQSQYGTNIIKFLEEEEQVLAKVNPIRIHTDIQYDLTDEEWEHLTSLAKGDHQEYTPEFLKKIANDNTRNIIIIDKLRKLAKEGKKILYFATDLSQSILVFAVLQKLGIKAIHVDGDTDKSFRKQIIKKFKETDEINIICNYGVFATGFDVPKLDTVFIARPVNSPVLFNQMLGRGSRGLRVGGTSNFNLYQIIDKITSKFIDFDPYEQYRLWDEDWEREIG